MCVGAWSRHKSPPGIALENTLSTYVAAGAQGVNIRHDYRLQQNRRTFTNYKKADWTQFTENTEPAFAQTTIPTNIHTANRIFTNIILMADKHNIPKGKMHSNCRLLPEDIVYKITRRNNIRRANTCDPALKLLNEEITSDIQKTQHMEGALRCPLGSQAQHTLWKTIPSLSNRALPHTLNTSITFNNKIEDVQSLPGYRKLYAKKLSLLS